jgi:NAD(P)H-dependent flavin oxidoreductase YrpB (nitropropane dioxygenase family)
VLKVVRVVVTLVMFLQRMNYVQLAANSVLTLRSVLIPAVVELCKGKTSPMTGKPVQVIAAGGIFNGATVAAALMLGATAVWVGTRFILTDEAGASKAHQEAVRTAGHDDNIRTIIFTVS